MFCELLSRPCALVDLRCRCHDRHDPAGVAGVVVCWERHTTCLQWRSCHGAGTGCTAPRLFSKSAGRVPLVNKHSICGGPTASARTEPRTRRQSFSQRGLIAKHGRSCDGMRIRSSRSVSQSGLNAAGRPFRAQAGFYPTYVETTKRS